MTTRSILLAVTEPQMLVDINQALGPAWEATSVANEAEALEQFEKRSFDALLVDFNLGSPDASELLNQAFQKNPKTVRFLSAYEADLALVAAKVNGTPHILPKPIEAASLKNRIENGFRDANAKQNGSEQVNDAPAEVPKVPAIYAEVLKAFESPDVTNEQLAEIISRDASLTSEIFRIANPSYLGIPRNITRPVEAVESLGLQTVKGIVIALQFLAEHRRLKPGYLSVEQLWQHSINVGQIARDLALLETKDQALASQALLAGLLHDLGKLVLAKNFEDIYGRVHSLARKQPVALCDVEKEMFGASHGEIGGCLLGMWNMPLAIVEATALHHEPPLGEHQQLTPLAAVHIANVLERELGSGDDGMMVAPIIHTPFLNQIGLLERLPIWRAALANRRPGDAESDATSTEKDSSNRTNRPKAIRPEKVNGASFVFPSHSRMGWVWAGAVGIALLLVLWFKTQQDISEIKQAYARTPAPPTTPAAVAPAAPAPTAPAPVAAVVTETTTPSTAPAAAVSSHTPAASIWEHAPALPLPYETDSQPSSVASAANPPAHEQVTAAAPTPVTKSNVQPAVVSRAPEKKPQPDFRLQGIIYTGNSSWAIVNGQRVNTGDQVDGATVLAITRTTVTLQIKEQRRIFSLR